MGGPRGVPESPLQGPRTATDDVNGPDGPDATIQFFLIADVRGYTDYTQRHGDEAAARLAGRFAAVTREVVTTQRGQLLELRGDEALVVFPSARQALRAALALQDRLVAETIADPSLALPVGIGLDVGEAVAVEGGFRGGALNLAARLCSQAGPGEVLASQEVAHLAGRVDGIRYVNRGRATLKGLAHPVPVVQVLHDPTDTAREAAFRAALREPHPRRRRPRLPVLVSGALVLVLATVAGAYALGRGEGPPPTALSAGDRADVLDVSTGKVVDQVLLGAQPVAVARGPGALWVANSGDGTVTRLDPDTHDVVATITVGGQPAGVAVSEGIVWVTDQAGQDVIQISPKVNRVVGTVPVGNRATGIAAGMSGVWVANTADGTVTRIDPHTAAPTTVDVGAGPSGIAVTRDTVWVTNGSDGTVSAIDAHSRRLRSSTPVGNGPAGVVVTAGWLWVANTLDGTLARVDPNTGAVTAVPVGNGPTGVAVADGALWVTNAFGGTVVRVDPAAAEVVRTAKLGGVPSGLAALGDELWVTASATGTGNRGGTLNVVARTQLTSIDPAIILGLDFGLHGVVYDQLLAFRKAAGVAGTTVVPDLAVAVPEPVDGGRTYSFRLRKGIRYSTGERVRASHVRRGIERSLQVPGSYVRQYYQGIVGAGSCRPDSTRCDLSGGIETDDAGGSVTIHLVAPDPEFRAKIAMPISAPAPPGVPDGDVGTAAVPATGPYMVGSFAPEKSLVLVRNPHFREWSQAAQPAGYPDRIVVRQLDDGEGPVSAEEGGLAEVLRGDVDLVVAYGSFRGHMQELRTRYPAQLHSESGNFMQYMQLNTRLFPFDDVRARRALSFAVDRTRMERLWVGSKDALQPSCQLLPPGFPGYSHYCPYARDMAEARRLVAESGSAGALVTLGVAKPQKAFGNYLARALESLGYRTTVTLFKGNDPYASASRRAADLHLVPYGWGADYPLSSQYLEPVLGCVDSLAKDPGSINLGGFCDPAVQENIEQALALQPTEPAAAARLWQQVDHAAVDQAAVLPIGILSEAVMTSSRVGNYQYQPVYGVLLDQLWVK